MLIKLQNWILTAIKGIGALALGGVVLWPIAQHCGAQKGLAYVHVPTIYVEVSIDDQMYPINALPGTPIVCELYPGRHTLRMARDEQIVFEEDFVLDPGKEIVLVAWDRVHESQTVITNAQPPVTESLAFRSRHAQRTSPAAKCMFRGCNHPR
jgi:hypothetical protein